MEYDKDLRSRQEARQLVNQAEAAFQELRRFDQARLDRIVQAVCAVAANPRESGFRA